MNPHRAILIAGPTASGKSALALALAERLGGAVINADSMQVYRELAILTARPSPEAMARAPHRLYGHVPGQEAYSAARFAREAGEAIAEAQAADQLPIVVGGTGLYFKALTEGLSPVPPIDPEIRAHWRSEADRIGASGLHDVLAARDPAMAARLEPTDPQRLVRAIEVLETTGRSLGEWQQQPGQPVVAEAETIRFVVMPERGELHRRCDARLDDMIVAGALDEVAALGALGLDPGLPVMRALGVRPLLAWHRGETPREQAMAEAKAETRQYAKRQTTWIRGNMSTWNTLSAQQIERMLEEILPFIKS